ncbi:hypothetical protein PAAG_06197 [Paracoccidioides lutzii Pb01]|uniref:Uncharacterized protein n=1 Tax=Paracoccidioides lutzii (strain ATCC MYA-826 / Pb01) TaxID=502779 RepID=C1H687_PARBA|nr:hypothetical protein PAAG_06197 [Paracoccidioides lutzii Pb01]EEH35150.2 hypothetical protein PAAG_06197 [Paracoccidioides lutzii Pb01]
MRPSSHFASPNGPGLPSRTPPIGPLGPAVTPSGLARPDLAALSYIIDLCRISTEGSLAPLPFPPTHLPSSQFSSSVSPFSSRFPLPASRFPLPTFSARRPTDNNLPISIAGPFHHHIPPQPAPLRKTALFRLLGSPCESGGLQLRRSRPNSSFPPPTFPLPYPAPQQQLGHPFASPPSASQQTQSHENPENDFDRILEEISSDDRSQPLSTSWRNTKDHAAAPRRLNLGDFSHDCPEIPGKADTAVERVPEVSFHTCWSGGKYSLNGLQPVWADRAVDTIGVALKLHLALEESIPESHLKM